jgi:hypothetical protein
MKAVRRVVVWMGLLLLGLTGISLGCRAGHAGFR